MQTAYALVAEEERFFQLTETNKQAWYKIQMTEYHEDWMQYDFMKDPTLLDRIGSLLVQLKLLT